MGEATGLVQESTDSITNPSVTEEQTITANKEIERLQKIVNKLQNTVDKQNEQLAKASEMNQEHVELKNQHWLQSNSLRLSNEELQKVKAENERLNREVSKLPKKLQIHINYNDVRDEYLASLKLGKQSPEYKRTKKHIDAFIAKIDTTSAKK